MLEIRGDQQSDIWIRSRVGRVTGSRMADASDWIWKGSKKRGDKRVEEGSKRKKYRRDLIAERLTGRLADHWYSEYMAHGEREEEPARMFYESLTRQMVIPVSFVIHEEFSFWGASADGLIGDEGVLEIKNPNTMTHLAYWEDGRLPEEYVPQVATELACAGKTRRFADFLSFDRRVMAQPLCYFLKRTGRDELEWEVPSGEEGEYRKLTGEAVIDYFAAEAVKLDAEITEWIQHRAPGFAPIAPLPLDFKEPAELMQPESGSAFDPLTEDLSYLDNSVAGTP